MTVEAAVAFPLFLFAVYLLWLFFSILSIQVELQAAADEVTGQLAQQSYLIAEWKGGSEEEKSSLSGQAEGFAMENILTESVWKAYAAAGVTGKIGAGTMTRAHMKYGIGALSVLRSTWHLDGDIDLRVDTGVKVRLLPGVTWNLSLTQHSVRRCWTGSQSRESEDRADAEEMVYITENGSVYHRDISCYHLTLTVRAVSASAVAGKRNGSGGNYRPCERCAVATEAAGTVFIAKEGDRYHTTRDCAGLKRTVKAVRISEAGGMRPCSSCGS